MPRMAHCRRVGLDPSSLTSWHQDLRAPDPCDPSLTQDLATRSCERKGRSLHPAAVPSPMDQLLQAMRHTPGGLVVLLPLIHQPMGPLQDFQQLRHMA